MGQVVKNLTENAKIGKNRTANTKMGQVVKNLMENAVCPGPGPAIKFP